MNPRELVRRTLEFDAPARVARQLWVLPWAEQRYPEALAKLRERYPDDLVSSPAFYRKNPRGEGNRYLAGRSVDEWGCVFENIQQGVIGEVKKPILGEWEDVDQVRIPVERLSVDVDEVNAFCRSTDRFVIAGCCPRPFERLQFIRGTVNLLMDLMDRPPELFTLLQRIHLFYCKEMELWAGTEVDALFIMDDWGSQDTLLIDPALFRELFKPLYKTYIDIAHGAGKYFFMHSDGHILDILPDLEEIGLGAVTSPIFCMGLEELGHRFRGKLTFWGEMDRQHLLPNGTVREIHEAALKMKETLYDGGGLIAQCEFGLNARPENVLAFYEALARI